MSEKGKSVAIVAAEAPARAKPSNYPEPFASRMAGREKRPLGDLFGLTNFGVNLTRLAPTAASALRHAHTSKTNSSIFCRAARRCTPMRAARSFRLEFAQASRPAQATVITW